MDIIFGLCINTRVVIHNIDTLLKCIRGYLYVINGRT